MRKTRLINKISSKNIVPSVKSMQVLDEQSNVYFNFINSLKSEPTRRSYKFCIQKFLGYYQVDLAQFLNLPQGEMTNLIIKYFVNKKISNQYKNLMSATLKHACEINDVVLNWKKIKKFIRSEKTGNEINGRDRAYTHEEIQKILEFSDQRLKTALLVLVSTGIRIGALQLIRIADLERIDNLYKIIVYSGDTEEYFTFCTPECAKEIDNYLEYRKRRGFMNTLFFIDGSNRAMVNLLKIRWDESLTWETSQSFGPNIRIRPVNFSTEHRNMLSNLHAIISKGYLAIEEKHDKLLTSLRTAYAEELNLKKEQTSYNDLLDALRLALKGYNIE